MERITTRVKDGDFEMVEVGTSDDYIKAVEMLADYEDTGLTPEQIMELKERDTAKVPIDADEDYGFFTCPSCGEAIYASDNFESHKFCLNCGQRLKQ